MRVRRDILVTIINAACTLVCALLAGCRLCVGELTLKDTDARIVLPYMVDSCSTNSPSWTL